QFVRKWSKIYYTNTKTIDLEQIRIYESGSHVQVVLRTTEAAANSETSKNPLATPSESVTMRGGCRVIIH
ncbi:hypothetical protein JYU34_021053, partial [Plutella xylostella]